MAKKLAIIYLSYHPQPFWQIAKKGLLEIVYPKEDLSLIIVDNPHPDHVSTKEFWNVEIENIKNKFSSVQFIPQELNTGFAGGMNTGIAKALERGSEYIFLHNQDGFVAQGAIQKLVDAVEGDATIGAAQALIRLYPETHLINSAGNYWHYLGFGYSGQYKKPFIESDCQTTKEVGYASGGAVMLRADLLKKFGAFEGMFESYHEDLEYSLRLRKQGFKSVVVGPAHFFHEYSFSRNINKYYLMERNRIALLLMYYRLSTLLVLAPLLILVEFGIYLQAIGAGWFNQKLKATTYWLNFKNVSLWRSKKISNSFSDRALIRSATSTIDFEGAVSPLVKTVMNFVFTFYFWLVKLLVWW